MENPYIIWFLMCNINSMKREELVKLISETAENLRRRLPSFDEVNSLFQEAGKLLSLIDENLVKYEERGDETFLEESENINEDLTVVFHEIYENLKIFNDFMALSKGDFLEAEGMDRAEKSGLFTALNLIVNEGFSGKMSEEDIWDALDKLRDAIYDTQDGELVLLEDFSKEAPPEVSSFFKDLSGLFKKGLANIEEGLEGIERAFTEGDKDKALESLMKARLGIGETKVFEMITEAGEVL